ncbi:hypothetical protein SALBM311S_07402 [Streptomyces alboniger]
MAKSGWSERAIQTVGGAKRLSARPASIRSKRRPASGASRMRFVRADREVRQQEHMHLGGVVERQRVDRAGRGALRSRAVIALRYSCTSARWVIIAPFGRAVVPDV